MGAYLAVLALASALLGPAAASADTPGTPTPSLPSASATPTPMDSPVLTATVSIGSPTPTDGSTLKINGSKSINISYGEARGDGGTGTTNQGYDRHEALRLNVEGQLNGKIKIQGHFAQSDLAEEDEYDLTLSTRRWELFFGDFSAGLPGSHYLSSGMSTTGVRLKGASQHWDFAALYGAPRGHTLYQKFYGNNTEGPYQVTGAPLVPGTETVWLDKNKLTRGVDYDLDALLGRLTFRNRIIQPVDLVEIQTQSSGSQFGTQVYGYRAGYRAGDAEKGGAFTLGQGYLGQFERPDPLTTTATGRAAMDTHMLELDSSLDFGPKLKVSGETAYSIEKSTDESVTPSRHGVATQAQLESFQGPLHLLGKLNHTEDSFNEIGNPLASNGLLEWSCLSDLKLKDRLFFQFDRAFQDTGATGSRDQTTTDHGLARAAPKGWPALEYDYYRADQVTFDPLAPFQQKDEKHTGSLGFKLPGALLFKTGAEKETRQGSGLGYSKSKSASGELSSQGWKRFNFSMSGEWKLTDILEAGSNTSLAQAPVGSHLPSETYSLVLDGRPVNHFSLTGKGTWTSDPPGPPRSSVVGSYQTDPFRWVRSNGSYTLEFQQRQVSVGEVPERVHTGSGGLDLTPWGNLKISTQPSFRLEVLTDGQRLSENSRQAYRATWNPKWMGLGSDYSIDKFATWDSTQAGFPLNFFQQTLSWNTTGRKALGTRWTWETGYKRSDQRQVTVAVGLPTDKKTLTQSVDNSINLNATSMLTLAVSHHYNQLNQDSPGQGNAPNPLLPFGPDSFNTGYSTNSLNIYTKAHTLTARSTERVTKVFSVYQEVGLTKTRDVIQGGTTNTVSPAAGFTWRPADFLNWTGAYQFNGSRGQVDTEVQKAQTTLSTNFNTTTSLALNWSWSKAVRPFVLAQQGTMSYTMNF